VNRRFLLHSRSFQSSARALVALLLVAGSGCSGSSPTPGGAADRPRAIELLNVSYDPTRELYRDINAAFATHYEQEHGTPVTIKQSHAASGSQSRAVIDGLDADVVTLATWPDVEAIAKSGLLRPDWQNRYENNSIPYHSVVVFVVRKGNPKNIQDWADLDRDDISIITPNPEDIGQRQIQLSRGLGRCPGCRRQSGRRTEIRVGDLSPHPRARHRRASRHGHLLAEGHRRRAPDLRTGGPSRG
jgi:sulfate/thiosulfate transport system substrate-binding protein